MSVYLDRVPPNRERLSHPMLLHGSPADCIEIGVINNMPDGALQSTERQFLALLDSASQDVAVRVTFYALSDVPRSEAGRRHLNRFYTGVEDLWDRQLDALIVTGNEPKTANLADEPYWGTFTRVVEWAEENTSSAVWSCLAAHAAVLHIDGIGRRRLDDKRFGLFDCARVSDHPLMAGMPPRTPRPHSRWNDLAETDLTASGYRVLTRSEHAGVDAFVKQRKSLFVFFQGHPEYEADSLALEYRRDVARYQRGERDTYPSMPHAYFDPQTAAALTAYRQKTEGDPREEWIAQFPALTEAALENRWHASAARFYGNWLSQLHELKESRSEAMHIMPVRPAAAAATGVEAGAD
jgi:homoserine O-succinyltransferase